MTAFYDFYDQALSLDVAVRAFHAATGALPNTEQLKAMGARLGVSRNVLLDVAFLHYEAADEGYAREADPEAAAKRVLGAYRDAADYNAYIERGGLAIPSVFGI